MFGVSVVVSMRTVQTRLTRHNKRDITLKVVCIYAILFLYVIDLF